MNSQITNYNFFDKYILLLSDLIYTLILNFFKNDKKNINQFMLFYLSLSNEIIDNLEACLNILHKELVYEKISCSKYDNLNDDINLSGIFIDIYRNYICCKEDEKKIFEKNINLIIKNIIYLYDEIIFKFNILNFDDIKFKLSIYYKIVKNLTQH